MDGWCCLLNNSESRNMKIITGQNQNFKKKRARKWNKKFEDYKNKNTKKQFNLKDKDKNTRKV